MDETRLLRLVSPPREETPEVSRSSDTLLRFRGLILNLTESALTCLNRISAHLHHYLDFIRRLCQGKFD
jgi:hypothetical protein